MYSRELTSSIFYTVGPEDEVYLRRCSSEETEGEVEHERGEKGGDVSPASAAHGWSTAHRKVDLGLKSFQRRFRRTAGRREGGALVRGSAEGGSLVGGSVEELPRAASTDREARSTCLRKRLSRRMSRKGMMTMDGDEVLCDAVAVKDCHPSPYDRQALAFRQGDRVQVVRMGPTGIWRGRCQGREGNFKFIDVRVEERRTRPRPGAVEDRIPRSQSVSDLLSSIRLENLTSVLVLNGYDTAGDIEGLCEEDLEYLGIAAGGARELLLETARRLAGEQGAMVQTKGSIELDLQHLSLGEETGQAGPRPSFLHSRMASRDSGICLAEV
jgi:hypothetical protein